MKITQEAVVMALTNVVGMCVLCFGLSQDIANTVQAAIPTIVGGLMSTVSVVTYLINRRKGKESVFMAIASSNFTPGTHTRGKNQDLLAVAKEIGLI